MVIWLGWMTELVFELPSSIFGVLFRLAVLSSFRIWVLLFLSFSITKKSIKIQKNEKNKRRRKCIEKRDRSKETLPRGN